MTADVDPSSFYENVQSVNIPDQIGDSVSNTPKISDVRENIDMAWKATPVGQFEGDHLFSKLVFMSKPMTNSKGCQIHMHNLSKDCT